MGTHSGSGTLHDILPPKFATLSYDIVWLVSVPCVACELRLAAASICFEVSLFLDRKHCWYTREP